MSVWPPKESTQLNLPSHPYFVPAGNLAGVNQEFAPMVSQVLDSGNLIGGQFVKTLELELAQYLDSKFVFTVASGMDALIISLTSLGLPENSPVLVADNGGGYASLAVRSSNLNPIFCDVSKNDYLVSIETLSKFEGFAKAIVVTHLYGQMADMGEIIAWASHRGIYVIEDCAQAFGAIQNGKVAGTHGDFGAFSFYPTKNLGGIGDGGAICTDNHELAKRISSLRQYGWEEKYNMSLRGARNSRLDAINAAVISAKLTKIDEDNIRRREILGEYIGASKEFEFFPFSRVGKDNVAHLAVGISQSPREMIEFFASRGVELTRHYPIQDSRQVGINPFGITSDNKNAKLLCDSVVSLPIYPWMSALQVSRVCNTLLDWGRNAK